MLTLFSTAAVTVMFLISWLEHRSTRLAAAFAGGAALTAVYGFPAQAHPIGGVEGAWKAVGLRRFLVRRSEEAGYGL